MKFKKALHCFLNTTTRFHFDYFNIFKYKIAKYPQGYSAKRAPFLSNKIKPAIINSHLHATRTQDYFMDNFSKAPSSVKVYNRVSYQLLLLGMENGCVILTRARA